MFVDNIFVVKQVMISYSTAKHLCYVLFFASVVRCQGETKESVNEGPETLLSNPCSGRETCSECITFDSVCGWCTKEGYTSDGKPRCDTLTNLAQYCPEDYFYPNDNMTKLVEPNSPKCSNGKGTFECGICKCYNNSYGRHCECDARDMAQTSGEKGCFFPNDTKPCSGRGVCHCGICECQMRENPEEAVTGTYCECDNFSCDRTDGQLCGGEEQGSCICGTCVCRDGWTGPDCDCRNTNETCIGPNGKICSGHGDCVCGQCKCLEMDEGRYAGLFCEDCPTCPGKCEDFKDCVLCQVFKRGPYTEEQCNTKCEFLAIQAPHIEVTEEGEKLCIFRDEDNCKYSFIYKLEPTNEYTVRAKNEREFCTVSS